MAIPVDLTTAFVLGAIMAAQDQPEIVPEKLPDKMDGVYYTLRVGDLTAVIGDHHDHGSGRPGYTALRHLSHRTFPYSCFRPRYAGLLHTRGTRQVDVWKVSDREVIVTPQGSRCGHWERIILTPPHYVDYEYNFYATSTVQSVNWCCYMNSLKDPGIYFLQSREWVRHYSPVHSIDASIAPNTMKTLPKYEKAPNSRYPSGYGSFSATFAPLRFDADRSFYSGHFHDLAFIWMFSRGDDIIPYMSPTGGGSTNNPAWDARYWLRDCVPGRKVSLKIRLALKPFVSNDDCLAEYMTWKKLLDGGELDKLRYPLWDVRGPHRKTFYLAKPHDRPFQAQVFKTQLASGAAGTAELVGPDGRQVARHDFAVDGDEHHTFDVRPDKRTGVYELRIDADDRSAWNVVTDLYREGLAADQPVTLHSRVSGHRFYFRVPKGTRSFRIGASGRNGTFTVFGPDGKPANSLDLGLKPGGAVTQPVQPGRADRLWSFAFESRDDVTVTFAGSSLPPAFAAYEAGCVQPNQ